MAHAIPAIGAVDITSIISFIVWFSFVRASSLIGLLRVNGRITDESP